MRIVFGLLSAAVLAGQALAAGPDLRGSTAAHEDPAALTGEAGEIVFRAVEQRRALAQAPEDPQSTDPIQRMAARTPDEIQPYFDLYLYVSKAASGSVAQNMFVYERGFDGRFTLLYQWPVSTGREQKERTPKGRRTFTTTPEGIFKLDPDRFYKNWRSRTWNADMPWAMFIEYVNNGAPSGIAIHAAGKSKISQLGRRASGGCIRLHPDHAAYLYHIIRTRYAGVVPVFAMTNNTTSDVGRPARLADGSMQLTQGYRVLMNIEDYGGPNLPSLHVARFEGTGGGVGRR